jgi:uncharacterized protein (TIGR03435 family)
MEVCTKNVPLVKPHRLSMGDAPDIMRAMARVRLVSFGAIGALLLSAQTPDARQKLIDSLDAIARTQLDARREAVARIQSRADAEKRRETVHRKVIELIGGLPESAGPVAVKSFGTIDGDGFHVEKLAYASLPNFWVTANVYVPTNRQGPFPAVVLTPGHEASGKTGQYSFGVNFARIGIVALAFDPIGQGERIQYYDAEKRASIVGGSTAEHGMANIPAMLIGDDLERYMVHDGMRAIDYLASRKDVDAARIGALGCSGGGTETAVLAALDDRVKAAGTACYITSFEDLLPSATGVQEAEQSIPHFIESGLDFADWVEAAAPRPYAIISTTADMFPFEGARQSYNEAKRIYGLYGAEDRLQWITGPGGHGNLGPISPAILSFFAKYLKGDTSEQQFIPVRPAHPDDLRCTPTGHIDGETVWSLNRTRVPTPHVQDFEHLRADIRALTGITWQPGTKAASLPDGVKSFRPEGAGPHAAVLWLDSADLTESPLKDGSLVLLIHPRPWPPGTESIKSPYLGAFNLLSLRAFLVGKTLVGIRADDVLEAADWVLANEHPSSVTVHAVGALGIVALHAAMLDPRITRVEVDDSLPTYRSIVDEPLSRNVSEIVIPGVLKKYDVPDLIHATARRPKFEEFEVASIKKAEPDARGRYIRMQTAHQFLAYNHALKTLIAAAYDVSPQAISSGPAWVETERYEILAKAPGDVRPNLNEQMAMLRALLAGRFKLTFHREQKEMPVYSLTVAKGGSKLRESTVSPDATPEGPPALAFIVGPGTLRLPARYASMDEFTSLLQRSALERPVVDRTGLAGRYDFDLVFSIDENLFGGALGKGPEEPTAPGLFAALQEQLGLKLEATRGPVSVLVIDHAERASEN